MRVLTEPSRWGKYEQSIHLRFVCFCGRALKVYIDQMLDEPSAENGDAITIEEKRRSSGNTCACWVVRANSPNAQSIPLPRHGPAPDGQPKAKVWATSSSRNSAMSFILSEPTRSKFIIAERLATAETIRCTLRVGPRCVYQAREWLGG